MKMSMFKKTKHSVQEDLSEATFQDTFKTYEIVNVLKIWLNKERK